MLKEILSPFADYITDITPTAKGYVVSLRMETGTIEFNELAMWEYAQEINLEYETHSFNNGLFNTFMPNGWMKIDVLLKESVANGILRPLAINSNSNVIYIPLNS